MIRTQRVGPEVLEPGSQRVEPFGTNGVEPTGAISAVAHEPGSLQHLEVLRDGGSAHGEVRGELTHRLRTAAQLFEHRTPSRVGQRLDRRSVSCH